jgi:hypothetical protein
MRVGMAVSVQCVDRSESGMVCAELAVEIGMKPGTGVSTVSGRSTPLFTCGPSFASV